MWLSNKLRDVGHFCFVVTEMVSCSTRIFILKAFLFENISLFMLKIKVMNKVKRKSNLCLACPSIQVKQPGLFAGHLALASFF